MTLFVSKADKDLISGSLSHYVCQSTGTTLTTSSLPYIGIRICAVYSLDLTMPTAMIHRK